MEHTIERVANFLQNHLKLEASNITPVSGGDWSQAFFFEISSQKKVIRLNTTDEDFRRDQFVYRYNSPGLPIPKVEIIGKTEEGYYAISERIEGEMIDHLSSDNMVKIAPQILSLFNALRQTDISDTTGYGSCSASGTGSSDSWHSFLSSVNVFDPSSRVDWRAGLASRPETGKLFDDIYQAMTQLLDYCPEKRHLIHNDLLHFNLITKENKIVGVIDWGCSLYGDYLYDLAMFDLWQFYYPSMQGIDWKGEAKKYFKSQGLDLTRFDERLKCYQCHLSLDSIKYTVFKNNDKDLGLITKRIMEIIR